MMITFLTPTYNRGYILNQLYCSLCVQKKKNFEWLVVDDGSTDNTGQLIEEWKKEADFPIQYIKIQNGGKHRALNAGILFANAPYTYIIDSDDYLTDDAYCLIEKWIMDIDSELNCAGVAGTRRTSEGKLIGQYPIGKKYVDAVSIKRRQAYLEGDKAEVYRTELLKKYPFPEFEGERFLSECAVWDRIGMDGYWIRWYPDALCICDYRDDGLTRSVNKEVENYQGYTFVICQQLMYETWLKKLALVAQYDQITNKRGGTRREVCKNLHINYLYLILARCTKQIHQRFIKGLVRK